MQGRGTERNGTEGTGREGAVRFCMGSSLIILCYPVLNLKKFHPFV